MSQSDGVYQGFIEPAMLEDNACIQCGRPTEFDFKVSLSFYELCEECKKTEEK